jgi:hypothetical protein
LADYAMVVPLARPIQYRGGGGGVVAAPATQPDAAPADAVRDARGR